MVVERRHGKLLLEIRLDDVEVGRCVAIQLDRDEARNRQRLELVHLAEPRLEQRRRFVHAQRPYVGDARLTAQKRRHVLHRLLRVPRILGLDLDRNFAGDITQPGIRRLADHVDRTGRETGQEAHDRDHHRERPARDRSGRHDRRGDILLLRSSRLARRRKDRCVTSSYWSRPERRLARLAQIDFRILGGIGVHGHRRTLCACRSARSSPRGRRKHSLAPCGTKVPRPCGRSGLSYDPDMAVVQLQAGGFELTHELMIVGGDQDGGTKPVELDEKAQQASRHLRVDVTGRLVGEEQLGFADHGPGDGRALLFSARQHGGKPMHAIAEANPLQKVRHVLTIILDALADDPERQRHVLPRREMLEQPEILEHDADAPPERRTLGRIDAAHVLAEKLDLPTRSDAWT